MALKTWLFAFATLYSMLAHAQYLPNFPHSISRLEYINRAHYAWHTEPAIYLYWGNQMDEYDMIGN
ncbi:MAG: hypothetical protein JXR22_09545, partial [Prolixibacteraceae bacterium]|nr:hypothetical protein [Prolixibacteraceae bacterium]